LESEVGAGDTESDSYCSLQQPTATDATQSVLSSIVGSASNSATEPHHPSCSVYSVYRGGKKSKAFRFQSSWYTAFPWIHSEAGVDGILCFYCMRSMKSQIEHTTHAIAKNAELTFVQSGFRNWKKAPERLKMHQSSHAHAVAVMHLTTKSTVTAQLSLQLQQQKAKARDNLLLIFQCVRYLARQGLALRGHEQDSGNLDQLLKLSSSSNSDLKLWLDRNQSYTSPLIQNEILCLLSNSITRAICKDVTEQAPLMFAVIVDGTRDVSGIEQESICIRYVKDDLIPTEVFLGFYEASKTTGESLAAITKDALLRLQLPVQSLAFIMARRP